MGAEYHGSQKAALPLGMAHIRLLYDGRGKAEDYLVLDVSPAFEALTGRSFEQLVGQKGSRLFGAARPHEVFGLAYCEGIIKSGKTQESVQWVEACRRYFRVTAIPAGRDVLALAIQEAGGVPTEAGPGPLPEDLDLFFNRTHDAVSLVAYIDGAFRFIRNNAVHQALTGFSSIEGLTPAQVAGEEVGARLVAYYETCMRTGRPVSYEQAFSFAPGARVWQTQVTPVFGADGVRYLLCSSKDVSELKQAQDEKAVLAQRLHAMFHRHSAVMLIIAPQTGRVLDANPAACAFYGYDKDELLRLTVVDLNIWPEGELQHRMERVAQKAEERFLFPHRLKSGEIRMVDVYVCVIPDGDQQVFYAIIHDATDREAYREQLYREKEMLRVTLRSIGDGVVTTDSHGLITSFNTVAQELTGWSAEEVAGLPFSQVFKLKNEETGQNVENPIQKVLETGRIVGLANHTELIDRQGERVPIADSAAPIITEEGEMAGVVMVFRDVSGEREYRRQIEFLSYCDALTGLHNRRFFEDELRRLDTAENMPLSVIMGDVNGLKLTNDVFGHRAGDALLKSVAGIFKGCCRPGDVIARWGGDEFVVLLPRTGLRAVEKVVQSIRDSRVAIHGSSLQLSLSLGCAVKGTAGKPIQAALREAEEDMYRQKLLEGKSNRNAIINTLLVTLYEKSNETEEHAKRMERHCHLIGQRLQLSSKEMDELSLLALLHDMGKVGIDPGVLRKRGKLTAQEWDEMRRHPEIGYRIAQATSELAVVAELILSHHERWDGQGYPRGLKGEEIPLACRILAVADAYDAMTNDRAYRKAVSGPEAVEELARNAGTQFEPRMVGLLIDILKQEDRGGGR